MRFGGIVANVTKDKIDIELETGTGITVPRTQTVPFSCGSAVIVDMTSGYPVVEEAPPITSMESVNMFMNFYPPSDIDIENVNTSVEDNETSFGVNKSKFLDIPEGAKTLQSSGTPLVFASKTSAGHAVTCESKMISRSGTNASEISAPVISMMLGRTIYVSNFFGNYTVEVDFSNVPVTGNQAQQVEAYSKIITNDMLNNGKTYEEAFESAVEGSSAKGFLETFGLFAAETLLTYTITRIKFSGDMNSLNEVFQGISGLDAIIGYAFDSSTGTLSDISSFEMELTPGDAGGGGIQLAVPSCETTSGVLYPITVIFGNKLYTITHLKMMTNDSRIVEFYKEKVTYAFKHGELIMNRWSSSQKNMLIAENMHSSVQNLAIGTIRLGSSTGYCGEQLNSSNILVTGDFNMNATGYMSFLSDETISLTASESIVLTGGTNTVIFDAGGSHSSSTS